MIGSAKPLTAPPQPPSPTGRRLAPSSCAPDSPPALTRAAVVESTGQSRSDGAAPPRPDEAAAAASSHALRASPQLSRWAQSRALRSGRRPGSDRATKLSSASASVLPVTSSPRPGEDAAAVAVEEDGDGDGDDDVCVAERDAAAGKAIYMVSDGTGWTAEHAVNAALGQFEHCFADRGCAVHTHLVSMIDNMDRLLEVIKQAAKEGALVLYTLADPSMAEAAKKACDFWGVPSTDVLRPTVEAIASHIGVAPSGIPRSSPNRKGQLTEDYFQRIDAIDFTIKQDDGAQPQNLNRADIVLAGVSRTGKTPLSIYLAQKGYKVANVPIVMGVNLPKSLFEISQDKIFGLTINPLVLQAIRKTRAKALGFGDGYQSNYAEMEHVRQELAHANQIFAQNPRWPVIAITGKAIEETAAVVVSILQDRKEKCSMPRISKRMDPRQSNVGEGSQGFVPGGNNGAYQPPWNPYTYGYQVPSGWFSQGFQPFPPNVPMMNPSSYAPEGFQPAELPEASKHNSEADVEEAAAPPASTGKRGNKTSGTRTKLGNFNANEDVNLVKSWLEISCDPITSTGQKRDRMWERIIKRYNLKRGSYLERSVRSLQSRWDIIKAEVGLFASYYADSIREDPSGMSDACKTTHAVGNFASVLKRKFGFLHCWELMKDEPKWQGPHLRDIATGAQGKGFGEESTQGPDTVDNVEGQSSPVRSGAQARRPLGRDSTKAAKKKAKSDAGSSSSAKYAARMQDLSLQKISIIQEEAVRKNDRFQQLASIDEKRFEEMRRHNESLLQIEQEKIRLMREKQEDERIKEEKKEDERILAVDLDACTQPLRLYYQTLQEEILEKITARRRRSQAP